MTKCYVGTISGRGLESFVQETDNAVKFLTRRAYRRQPPQAVCYWVVVEEEVGRRTLGIQTFWFQAVCANHLVQDPVEVIEFTRKHTASVHDGLREIRRIIETLVARRDARRDSFVRVVTSAMRQKLGPDADAVAKEFDRNGIPRKLARDAGKSFSSLQFRRTPMSSSTKSNRPVHEVRIGRVRAAIWENDTQNGMRHNVTLSRLYNDGDGWKDSTSFGRDDLPLVAKVADQAQLWIYGQSQKPNGSGETF